MYLQRRWKWTTSTKIHGWQKGNSEIVIILYVNCSLETESLCLVGTTEESNDAVRTILARSTGDGGRVMPLALCWMVRANFLSSR